ncbi:SNF2-related protein [Brevibacterium sp.]|uniref:DEAD/DEAH box helicase n=1 Tax=Brevibacterium sp. TaxID=1701 RepID=UPI0028112D2C|nr:SNF2-related protein [Brevibacterium sp.]
MSTAPPFVPPPEIIALVGQASFQRGSAYARGGHVLSARWSDEEWILTGEVAGNAPQPYRVRISVEYDEDEHSAIPEEGDCTCPIGFNCKHVAAVLMAGNEHSRAHLISELSSTAGVTTLSSLARTQADVRAAAPPQTPEWQSRLERFAVRPANRQPTIPLGLGFELRSRPQRSWYSHTSTTPLTAEDLRKGVLPSLVLRPIMPGKKNNWIKGNLNWGTLVGGRSSLNLDRAQSEWFAQFAELHAAVYTAPFGRTDELELDTFDSPLVWSLLDWATNLDIALIGLTKGLTIRRSPPGQLRIDTTRSSDGLRLTPQVVVEEATYDAGAALPIGHHGFYCISVDGTRIDLALAPTRTPLTAEQRELLINPAPIDVPEAHTEEFFDSLYPQVRLSTPVISSDESVDLPELQPARLHLTAAFGRSNRLQLSWSWHYHNPDRILHLIPVSDDNRDVRREKDVLAEVRAIWPSIGTQPREELIGIETAEFTSRVLPQLEALDEVEVQIEGTRPEYQELSADPHVKVTTAETDTNDWFDLGFEVTVDGTHVPFVDLFRALATGQDHVLLDDHTFFSLDHPSFDKLRELLTEAQTLSEWSPQEPSISRYQAGLWAELEDLADETDEATGWQESVRALSGVDPITEVDVPDTVHADLRHYQREGFRWLTFLWKHHLGGILADDMGLGKTLQTLALIAHTRATQTNPFLVVAPTSVVGNWNLEAAKFTPDLRVRVIDATSKKRRTPLEEEIEATDVVITSYAVLRLDAEAFQSVEWAGLILDEAQFVKNNAAKVHQAARAVKAPFRLAITGTPMENSLTDLWSLSSIVSPGLFPSRMKFREEYVRPIESGEAPERMETLRKRVRPFMLRRTKELVAAELPDKQEQVLTVELGPRHRKLYDAVLQRERKKLLGLMDDLDRNRFAIFRSLTLLRMLALDPGLVDPEHDDVGSSKVEALFDHLDDVIAEGHRALVFSQFTSFLHRIAAQLDARGVDYAYLDGSTRSRAKVIESFRSGSAPVFLISLKAGGFGLTLTEADYVFLMDPWWNPAAESQAIDRTHRIGQTRNVMVYRLVSEGTIEEKVVALQQKKAELFTSLMDDGEAFSSTISADDIRALLGE